LQTALDVKQSKPAQADGIVFKEMADKTGRHFIFKNARAHTYARLTPEEFWLWERMDGVKTVQQLVLDYFMKFKAFAFAAVVSLAGRLREQQMLKESPRSLYAGVSHALHTRSFIHKLTLPARAVFTWELTIKGLDGHLDRIYRYGGWLLFTRPMQSILLLISIIGIMLFIRIASDPRYHLFGEGIGSIMLTLGLIMYIPLVIHEFGHAITAKHFGCEVYKGGAMLYYGMPAAFVDTTDIWMQGKRARLAVTWAGPYTGYIIAGACALVAYYLPSITTETATFLLQISLVSIFASTYNVLPVLKLDGYYLLADALEIPRLRERSMDFIFKDLRPKIAKREKWTREEKIFLAFGILAILSTVYFTYAAIRFWDDKTTSSISRVFSLHYDAVAQAKNGVMVLLAASSIAYSVYLLVRHGAGLIQWLGRVGLLSTRGRSALAVVIGAAALALLPQVVLPTLSHGFTYCIGVIAFGFAAWLAFVNYRKMRGSIHAGMWLAATAGLCIGAAHFAGVINARFMAWERELHEAGLGVVLLTFVFSGRMLPGLVGSWRAFSMGLIALGCAAWAAGLFTPALFAQTFAGLMLLGGLLHWNMRPATQAAKGEGDRKYESTRSQITDAFNQIKLTILRELESDFGQRTRKWVENGYYRAAHAWYVRARKADEAQIVSTIAGMTLNDYGSAMAITLEDLLVGVGKAAGNGYAARALAYGYDGLDWELQELAEDYLLKYVRHAAGLSKGLADTRNDVDALVRSVPLFTVMTEDEIAALCKRLTPKRFGRGDVIVRLGDAGNAFYVIRMGKVEVLDREEQQIAQLTRGDYFGEIALLSNETRKATVRAMTPVEVFSLNRNDFNRLINKHFKKQGRTPEIMRRLSLLRQIPLFAGFEGSELCLLEKKLLKSKAPAGETIFKHGERGNFFYVIESGAVSVQLPMVKENGETGYVERATLSSGEYFGEMALLMDAPRAATVTATAPTTLLKLSARDFAGLLDKSKEMKQAAERAGSRRALSNERWLRQGVAEGV